METKKQNENSERTNERLDNWKYMVETDIDVYMDDSASGVHIYHAGIKEGFQILTPENQEKINHLCLNHEMLGEWGW
jgi:hypothetical protein